MHRLDRSVEYVMDKDKTSRTGAGSASSLAEAVDDARDREKTECGVFESAIGCTLDTAYRDMRANKERWGRMDGVQGYHMWPRRNTGWTSVPFPLNVCAKCAPAWSRRSRGAF